MNSKSAIEWTDATWNPVTGCDKVSPGCTNCYAGELVERRLQKTGLPQYKDGFFGNVQCHPHKLAEPMKWRKPKMVFVNSMSDLFHEKVPFEFINDIFLCMSLCKRHTFQILTKRPARALEYLAECKPPILPNIWLGVSCEDQRRADERIPLLLQCPTAVRFVSLEPLLGPIELDSGAKLDWVIVGGESGPKARPMDPAWARDLRNQCTNAGVPFFFKQWGKWAPWNSSVAGSIARLQKKNTGRLLDGREWNEMPNNV